VKISVDFLSVIDVLDKWRTGEEVLVESTSMPRRFLSGLITPIILLYFQRLTTGFLDCWIKFVILFIPSEGKR